MVADTAGTVVVSVAPPGERHAASLAITGPERETTQLDAFGDCIGYFAIATMKGNHTRTKGEDGMLPAWEHHRGQPQTRRWYPPFVWNEKQGCR